MFTQLVYT